MAPFDMENRIYEKALEQEEIFSYSDRKYP